MKRTMLLLVSGLLLLASCASSKPEAMAIGNKDGGSSSARGIVNALSARGIVSALSSQQGTIIQSLPAGSRIAVLDIDAGDNELSVFTTEEIIKTLVKTRQFRILDRDSIETLRKEQNFQMSGEVDDATAVSIGKFMGASVVITGIIRRRYEQTDISLKILDVETTEIIDLISIPVLE